MERLRVELLHRSDFSMVSGASDPCGVEAYVAFMAKIDRKHYKRRLSIDAPDGLACEDVDVDLIDALYVELLTPLVR